ncbi:MAG: hypothetical protein LBB92_02935 [Endomicrobium sp.]|jgi:AAA family ATP:ADP antiporter|nr:hypothetical protein [Endomicrobium sp.]
MKNLLMKMCNFSFGSFEEQEIKKFVRFGIIFFLLIGVYWTLRPLKDSIFMQIVGKTFIPFAKTISLILILPILSIYTKILRRFKQKKTFQILIYFYMTVVTLFVLPIFLSQSHIITNKLISNVIGYSWYFTVESFGSIMIALFWGILTDNTDAQDAKKGFALIYFFGQIGGAILPCTITGIPFIFGMKTDIISLLIVMCAMYLIIPTSEKFFEVTSIAYNDETNKKAKFIDGIKLLCSHKYLMGLLLMELSFEFVMTIIDFNFKMLAGTVYSRAELTQYLAKMGASVNALSALIIIFLSNRIQRLFSLKTAILTIPVIVGGVFLYFINTNPFLKTMFILVIIGKAVNYAFRPSFKQLYIPTTPDVHFRLQAWNDVFGSRSAKQLGSVFNMFYSVVGKMKYLMFNKVIGFPLVTIWIATAFYLGKTHEKAINNKKIII